MTFNKRVHNRGGVINKCGLNSDLRKRYKNGTIT